MVDKIIHKQQTEPVTFDIPPYNSRGKKSLLWLSHVIQSFDLQNVNPPIKYTIADFMMMFFLPRVILSYFCNNWEQAPFFPVLYVETLSEANSDFT